MIVLKMPTNKPSNLLCIRNIFLLVISACLLISCGDPLVSREYEEIVIKPASSMPQGMTNDPHAFMGFDHPPIGDMQTLASNASPDIQKALDESVVQAPLSWTTPKGWNEQKGSGMRLATFTADGPVECTLIVLGGQAGGIESNVLRWMRQVNVSFNSDGELRSFLLRQKDIQAKGGFTLKMIDLTEVSQPNAPSMMAAIAELESMTIFIKMTGQREAIIKQRQSFEFLIQSLTLES